MKSIIFFLAFSSQLFTQRLFAEEKCLWLHGVWGGTCTTGQRSFKINEGIYQSECLILRINGLSYQHGSIRTNSFLENESLGTSSATIHWVNSGSRLSILFDSLKQKSTEVSSQNGYITYEMEGNSLIKRAKAFAIKQVNGNMIEESLEVNCIFGRGPVDVGGAKYPDDLEYLIGRG
jgi:hypothetical protein